MNNQVPGTNKFPQWLRKSYKIIFLVIFCLVVITGIVFAIHKISTVLHTKRELEKLAKDINVMAKNLPGRVSFVIKDLRTGVCIKQNADELFPSASLVKVPLMACVYKAAEDGLLSLDEKLILKRSHRVEGGKKLRYCRIGTKLEITRLIELMIDESNNIATNMLTERLGLDYINDTFKQFGLKKTNFDRYIMDLKARNRGIDNWTTAEEITELLEKIYSRKLVNSKASEQMLEILMKQEIRDRIPKWLPKDIQIANKTGYLRQTCHDAGIVFSVNGDFIVCVLTHGVKKTKLAKNFIREVGYRTYMQYTNF